MRQARRTCGVRPRMREAGKPEKKNGGQTEDKKRRNRKEKVFSISRRRAKIRRIACVGMQFTYKLR